MLALLWPLVVVPGALRQLRAHLDRRRPQQAQHSHIMLTVSQASGAARRFSGLRTGVAPERAPCAAQVGAALSMVYCSGCPVMFVGVGQTYPDLTRLNVKAVVRSLLK